jgi:hypothetical protein
MDSRHNENEVAWMALSIPGLPSRADTRRRKSKKHVKIVARNT